MKRLVTRVMMIGLTVVVFGTIYVVAQQVQRSDANWPQIQLAEDTAVSLNHNDKPEWLISGGNQVNINQSLAPFTIIYDKAGKPAQGTGYLDGQLPSVPLGVLTAAKGKTYSTVTWQPKAGVRIAAVTVAAKDYYVVSGRSLAEVEKNETRTLQLSALGGLASLMLLLVIFVFRQAHPD